jgi:hypothetical protein
VITLNRLALEAVAALVALRVKKTHLLRAVVRPLAVLVVVAEGT